MGGGGYGNHSMCVCGCGCGCGCVCVCVYLSVLPLDFRNYKILLSSYKWTEQDMKGQNHKGFVVRTYQQFKMAKLNKAVKTAISSV